MLPSHSLQSGEGSREETRGEEIHAQRAALTAPGTGWKETKPKCQWAEEAEMQGPVSL